MTNSKQDYIYKSLKKITHKGWESFVITRLIHRLDDDDIEFITQQAVQLPNGKRALTDIYFPQFALHVEVDEKYHESDRQLKDDEKREQDIVQITGHEITRIKIAEPNGAYKELGEIRQQVDDLVNRIKELKVSHITEEKFAPWDFETRYLSDRVIKKGFLDVDDNDVFQLQIEALKCFGFKGKGYQRGAWKIPDGSNDVVWFPRLYRHGCWHNYLENSGKTIVERAVNGDGLKSIKEQRAEEEKYKGRNHIVFAKSKDALGFNLLRYVGTFEMALFDSTDNYLIFKQIRSQEPIRNITRK